MSGKDKGGRPPTILTEEQISQVEALSAYLNQNQIADYFSIGERTFRDIMNRQPDVSAAYKRGKAKAIESVATGLLEKARDGDTSSQIFYLKTQAGWKESQQIDHTSSDGSMSLNQFYAGTQEDESDT